MPAANVVISATFKAVSGGGDGGGGSSTPSGSSVWLTTPATPSTSQTTQTSTAQSGTATFTDNIFYRVVMPDSFSGDVSLDSNANVPTPSDRETFAAADISISADMVVNGIAAIQFKIPLQTSNFFF